MLTCALIVWMLQPLDWDKESLRETFLTKTECMSNFDESNNSCIKIDKRTGLKAVSDSRNSIFEYYLEEHLPK